MALHVLGDQDVDEGREEDDSAAGPSARTAQSPLASQTSTLSTTAPRSNSRVRGPPAVGQDAAGPVRRRGTQAVSARGARVAPLLPLGLGRPGGGDDRRLPLAFGSAAGTLLAHRPVLTATRPSCAAARRRRRRTSPGGTGSPSAGRSRPRRRTGRRRGRLQVTSGATGAVVGHQLPRRARRRSARSRSARPRRRRTACCPGSTSTVFQPMCGTTGAWSRSTTPGHSSQPSVSTPCSTPRSKRICMPTQMPSTGRPPARRRPMIRSPLIARSPSMHAANAPTPGYDEPVGLERGWRSRR